MSVAKVVLGLVIERPDHGYQLVRRLDERFGSAQFVPSSVYKALERLEKAGLIRAVAADPGTEEATNGALRAPGTKYVATRSGVEHFRNWLLATSSAPLVREELQVRIALCEPRDLPRLIEVVQGEELACLGRLEELSRRLDQGEFIPEGQEWSRLMGSVVDHAEAALWDARIKWLRRVRMFLEQLRGESSRRSSSRPALPRV
jgi:DNA-binding PadR family transcriptional regulator